ASDGSRVDLIHLLREPARHAPNSLKDQLAWIAEHWGALLGDFRLTLLSGIDMINEEQMPRFPQGRGPIQAYSYRSMRHEYEKFSPDRSWMPSLVLLAKNALVWLHQLSRLYGLPIRRLDDIPEEELLSIAERGINGLWLIGIWERSPASEKIKKLCGNPDAAASAYSLFDYEISPELGGWEALDRFRERCRQYGIRLAADMVPNHTGIESRWVRERPDLFISLAHCPFPSYTFNGPDLSSDPTVGIWLEDHYYSRTDAAVVFKRLDRKTGNVRYIYHGNDGTSMPWNDTAQIDFLNPAAREAVMERILHVAQHFNIIRFDAAMVLAKQHIRRLWYPAPGMGGAIPSRSDHAMSDEAFDKALPNEFWREVVDQCAQKAPDTLLLAEAFWLMEGYFVRTLGMHRVYNSA
ncbi:MAG: alpha-amylase family glycosyl hydrolase, partial [Rectinema sp.]|nr:alpha-amylase family glycosyl hydrolase [Rectinema sp.]